MENKECSWAQEYGLDYLFSVGVPSLISAMNSERINEAPFSSPLMRQTEHWKTEQDCMKF